MKKVKNILDLSAKDARNYLMKAEQYSTFELPEYFDFQPVLDYAQQKIGDSSIEDCLSADPYKMNDVNLDILLNKDGKYAIRPLSLVNPYLYSFLVRDICSEGNWRRIKDCFSKYTLEKITACAIPVISEGKESFHGSTTVLNWWNSLEQRSVELSLEYRYMFVSDITNCYGNINPQTIGTALSMKGTKYECDGNNGLSDRITMYLRALQNGMNIGIPQGSETFNLLAEIILGYADLLLAQEIEKNGIKSDYRILRYRDDYRVFCNDKDDLEEISYLLQKVLMQLNFQMNSKKTMISESIITDSIKQDKQFYIFNTPIFRRRRVINTVKDENGKDRTDVSYEYECDFNGLQKHLLFILMFGRKYPNSGQIRTQLNEFDSRVSKMLDKKESARTSFTWEEIDLDDEYFTKSSNEGKDSGNSKENDSSIFNNLKKYNFNPIRESIRPMVAIAAQIAQENITAAHYALRVVSRLIDTLPDSDPEKKDLVQKVCEKLRKQHNTPYLEVWLQNLTYSFDKITDESHYELDLCRLVMGEEVSLWNNSWLSPDMYSELPYDRICDKKKLEEVTPVIKIKSRFMY
jgi:hypothetical protein